MLYNVLILFHMDPYLASENFSWKPVLCTSVYNTELDDLRKLFLWENLKGLLKKFSVCTVIEDLAEHGIHCLQCFYTNDVINILP